MYGTVVGAGNTDVLVEANRFVHTNVNVNVSIALDFTIRKTIRRCSMWPCEITAPWNAQREQRLSDEQNDCQCTDEWTTSILPASEKVANLHWHKTRQPS